MINQINASWIAFYMAALAELFVIEEDVVILVNYERNNSSRNVRNAYNVQYFILKKYLLSMLGNIPNIP